MSEFGLSSDKLGETINYLIECLEEIRTMLPTGAARDDAEQISESLLRLCPVIEKALTLRESVLDYARDLQMAELAATPPDSVDFEDADA